MRTKLKKLLALFCAACALIVWTAGCGSSPASAPETEAKQTDEAPAPEEPEDVPDAPAEGGGKWHVLDPETAAALDADFVGTVWKIAEGAFSIAETKTKLLEDGSQVSSSPSSNADIPDSQLIQVVVDDDTYFYVRTIYDNGKRYEDVEAGFQDLEEHISVEMKGSFENDVFYASEIRIVKVS